MLLLLAVACALPEVSLPPQGPQAHGLILLVHGAQEDPSTWAEDLVQDMGPMLPAPEAWDLVAYDWSQDADDRWTAASWGQRHGEALGLLLNKSYDYQAVQVVAHSAGAHVADGLARTWQGPVLQQTFLDPFGGRGLIRWGYGRNHFGEGATWADCAFNTTDSVPATDQAPDHSHGYDVTALLPDDWDPVEESHWWPIQWYAESQGTGLGLDLALPLGGEALWQDFPEGETEVLSD